MTRKQLLIRIPEALAGELDRLSEELHQPRNHLVLEALAFYLTERADLDVALNRLRDPNADWVSHEEAKREILGD